MDNRTNINLKTIDSTKLEKILCLMINENKEYLGIPDEYFKSQEAKNLFKQIKQSYIINKRKLDLEPDKIEELVMQNFKIEQIIEEIQSRKILNLAHVDFTPKRKILTLKDKYKNEFNIFERTLYGITGFNGHGKTALLIYISYILSQKYNVVYCLNEDRSIITKLKEDVLNKVNFYFPRDIETIVELIFTTRAEIVCIDAITSAKTNETKNIFRIFEIQDILWTLSQLTDKRTIFVVNHLKKKIKEEKNPEDFKNIFFINNSYVANFANLIDVGFAVIRGKGITIVKVEKDRETDDNETMLNTIFEFDFFKIKRTIMKEGV